MTWNTGLTGAALNIAQIDTAILRVMAGPGTGKSFAMKRRVMRLLEEQADPERILAVTFTRTAAASLVKELRDLGVPGCEHIEARTLHSFCFSLLSRRDVFEYLDRTSRPLVTFSDKGVFQFETAPMLRDLFDENGAFVAPITFSARTGNPRVEVSKGERMAPPLADRQFCANPPALGNGGRTISWPEASGRPATPPVESDRKILPSIAQSRFCFGIFDDRLTALVIFVFWVITEADRSATTILLPSEY